MSVRGTISAEEAVSHIRSGDTIMVGGFGLVGAPLTLIDALAARYEGNRKQAAHALESVLDTITRALQPMRRLGVDPEGIALAFSLLLRGIPTTLQLADETRDAAIARGLERDPRARLTPLVIRVVAHARATGDALHARGIHD